MTTDPLTLLTYVLLATAVLLIATGLVWRWKSRRLDPAEAERQRRLHINRVGRIVEGRVVELKDEVADGQAPAYLLVYKYEVRGVEYQAAQDISFFRHRVDFKRLAAGQPTSVKYDPQNPTNSIVLCEDWSGL